MAYRPVGNISLLPASILSPLQGFGFGTENLALGLAEGINRSTKRQHAIAVVKRLKMEITEDVHEGHAAVDLTGEMSSTNSTTMGDGARGPVGGVSYPVESQDEVSPGRPSSNRQALPASGLALGSSSGSRASAFVSQSRPSPVSNHGSSSSAYNNMHQQQYGSPSNVSGAGNHHVLGGRAAATSASGGSGGRLSTASSQATATPGAVIPAAAIRLLPGGPQGPTSSFTSPAPGAGSGMDRPGGYRDLREASSSGATVAGSSGRAPPAASQPSASRQVNSAGSSASRSLQQPNFNRSIPAAAYRGYGGAEAAAAQEYNNRRFASGAGAASASTSGVGARSSPAALAASPSTQYHQQPPQPMMMMPAASTGRAQEHHQHDQQQYRSDSTGRDDERGYRGGGGDSDGDVDGTAAGRSPARRHNRNEKHHRPAVDDDDSDTDGRGGGNSSGFDTDAAADIFTGLGDRSFDIGNAGGGAGAGGGGRGHDRAYAEDGDDGDYDDDGYNNSANTKLFSEDVMLGLDDMDMEMLGIDATVVTGKRKRGRPLGSKNSNTGGGAKGVRGPLSKPAPSNPQRQPTTLAMPGPSKGSSSAAASAAAASSAKRSKKADGSKADPLASFLMNLATAPSPERPDTPPVDAAAVADAEAAAEQAAKAWRDKRTQNNNVKKPISKPVAAAASASSALLTSTTLAAGAGAGAGAKRIKFYSSASGAAAGDSGVDMDLTPGALADNSGAAAKKRDGKFRIPAAAAAAQAAQMSALESRQAEQEGRMRPASRLSYAGSAISPSPSPSPTIDGADGAAYSVSVDGPSGAFRVPAAGQARMVVKRKPVTKAKPAALPPPAPEPEPEPIEMNVMAIKISHNRNTCPVTEKQTWHVPRKLLAIATFEQHGTERRSLSPTSDRAAESESGAAGTEAAAGASAEAEADGAGRSGVAPAHAGGDSSAAGDYDGEGDDAGSAARERENGENEEEEEEEIDSDGNIIDDHTPCAVCGLNRFKNLGTNVSCKLLGCDGPCGRWFHLRCIKKYHIPKGEWMCDECKQGLSVPQPSSSPASPAMSGAADEYEEDDEDFAPDANHRLAPFGIGPGGQLPLSVRALFAGATKAAREAAAEAAAARARLASREIRLAHVRVQQLVLQRKAALKAAASASAAAAIQSANSLATAAAPGNTDSGASSLSSAALVAEPDDSLPAGSDFRSCEHIRLPELIRSDRNYNLLGRGLCLPLPAEADEKGMWLVPKPGNLFRDPAAAPTASSATGAAAPSSTIIEYTTALKDHDGPSGMQGRGSNAKHGQKTKAGPTGKVAPSGKVAAAGSRRRDGNDDDAANSSASSVSGYAASASESSDVDDDSDDGSGSDGAPGASKKSKQHSRSSEKSKSATKPGGARDTAESNSTSANKPRHNKAVDWKEGMSRYIKVRQRSDNFRWAWDSAHDGKSHAAAGVEEAEVAFEDECEANGLNPEDFLRPLAPPRRLTRPAGASTAPASAAALAPAASSARPAKKPKQTPNAASSAAAADADSSSSPSSDESESSSLPDAQHQSLGGRPMRGAAAKAQKKITAQLSEESKPNSLTYVASLATAQQGSKASSSAAAPGTGAGSAGKPKSSATPSSSPPPSSKPARSPPVAAAGVVIDDERMDGNSDLDAAVDDRVSVALSEAEGGPSASAAHASEAAPTSLSSNAAAGKGALSAGGDGDVEMSSANGGAASPSAVPSPSPVASSAADEYPSSAAWAPGSSRYIDVNRATGNPQFAWRAAVHYTSSSGKRKHDSAQFRSRSAAQAWYIERCDLRGIDTDDRIREGWPGDAEAKRLEADAGIDWKLGIKVAGAGGSASASSAAPAGTAAPPSGGKAAAASSAGASSSAASKSKPSSSSSSAAAPAAGTSVEFDEEARAAARECRERMSSQQMAGGSSSGEVATGFTFAQNGNRHTVQCWRPGLSRYVKVRQRADSKRWRWWDLDKKEYNVDSMEEADAAFIAHCKLKGKNHEDFVRPGAPGGPPAGTGARSPAGAGAGSSSSSSKARSSAAGAGAGGAGVHTSDIDESGGKGSGSKGSASKKPSSSASSSLASKSGSKDKRDESPKGAAEGSRVNLPSNFTTTVAWKPGMSKYFKVRFRTERNGSTRWRWFEPAARDAHNAPEHSAPNKESAEASFEAACKVVGRDPNEFIRPGWDPVAAAENANPKAQDGGTGGASGAAAGAGGGGGSGDKPTK